MNFGIAGENRKLTVDQIAFGLNGDDIVVELVDLVFVQERGVVGSGPEVAKWRLIRIVGYLQCAVRSPGDDAQTSRIVEHGRHVGEELALIGVIVKRIERGGRIFDPEVIKVAPTSEEILGIADAATVIKARLDRLPAAAIDTDVAARRGKAPRGDVEDAGGATAVLG